MFKTGADVSAVEARPVVAAVHEAVLVPASDPESVVPDPESVLAPESLTAESLAVDASVASPEPSELELEQAARRRRRPNDERVRMVPRYRLPTG